MGRENSRGQSRFGVACKSIDNSTPKIFKRSVKQCGQNFWSGSAGYDWGLIVTPCVRRGLAEIQAAGVGLNQCHRQQSNQPIVLASNHCNCALWWECLLPCQIPG